MKFNKPLVRNTLCTFIAAEISIFSIARTAGDTIGSALAKLADAVVSFMIFARLLFSRIVQFQPSGQQGQDRKSHRPQAVPDDKTPQPTDFKAAVALGANSPAKERNSRKLALLKRGGLFSTDTLGAVIERACSLEDLRKAYRLVHDVYLGTGYIVPEPAGLRLRIFETTSDTATFIAKVDGRVVGVLSVVGDSPELGLPSDTAFKNELDALRGVGLRLGEVTNQAVADEYRRSAVPTELMRCAIAHGIKGSYDFAIATVSPSHTSFYELLGFQQVGTKRSYSEKIHDPVIAIGMNMKQYRRPSTESNEVEAFVHGYLTKLNPYMLHVEEWTSMARRHFFNPDLLQQLFVSERNFLAECSPEELQVLHRRWGSELFAAVTGDLFLPNLVPLESNPSPPITFATPLLRSTESVPLEKSPHELVFPESLGLGKNKGAPRSKNIARLRTFARRRRSEIPQDRDLRQTRRS